MQKQSLTISYLPTNLTLNVESVGVFSFQAAYQYISKGRAKLHCQNHKTINAFLQRQVNTPCMQNRGYKFILNNFHPGYDAFFYSAAATEFTADRFLDFT